MLRLDPDLRPAVLDGHDLLQGHPRRCGQGLGIALRFGHGVFERSLTQTGRILHFEADRDRRLALPLADRPAGSDSAASLSNGSSSRMAWLAM